MQTQTRVKAVSRVAMTVAIGFLGVSMLAAAGVARMQRDHDVRSNENRTDRRVVVEDVDFLEERHVYEAESLPYRLDRILPDLRKKVAERDRNTTYHILVVLKEQADTRNVRGDYRAVMKRRLDVTQRRDRSVQRTSSARGRMTSSGENVQQLDIRAFVGQLEQKRALSRAEWFTLVNAFSAVVTTEGLVELNNHEEVAAMDVFPVVESTDSENPEDADSGEEETDLEPAYYGPEYVKAPQVWAMGYTGQNIRVGVIDSDLDGSHPMFTGKLDQIQSGPHEGELAFFDGKKITAPYLQNSNSHGTHVSGIVVGGTPIGSLDTIDNEKHIGVAPDAKLVFGMSGNPAASFEWMANPDGNLETDDYPVVVNNSWIHNLSPIFTYWIDALHDLGITVVFSAGNSGGAGPGSIKSLHKYPSLLLVGNTTKENKINQGSSKGPVLFLGEEYTKPDVSAPGTDILSSVPAGGYATYKPNKNAADALYKELTGTSMAAPMVTGAIVLMQQAYFEHTGLYLSPGKVKSIMQLTAQNMQADSGKDTETGSGLVDIPNAIELALNHVPVHGQVKNTKGVGIPFAILSFVYDGLSYELYADKDGYYDFALPEGSYTFSFSKKGHTSKQVSFTGVVGEAILQDATLADQKVSLSFYPYDLDFKSGIGGQEVKAIEVYNHGSEMLVIDGVDIKNDHFGVITAFPIVVEPFSSKEMLVSYTPSEQVKGETGSISFMSNTVGDAGTLQLSGTGGYYIFSDTALSLNITKNNLYTGTQIGAYAPVIWADVNGDSFDDLLTAENNAAYVSHLENMIAINSPGGAFVFPEDQYGLSSIFHDDVILKQSAIADINNDGRQDMVVYLLDFISKQNKLGYMLQDEDGGFGPFVSIKEGSASVLSFFFTIIDFDNDGLLDIVTRGRKSMWPNPPMSYIASLIQKVDGSGNMVFEEIPVFDIAEFQDFFSQKLYSFDYNNDGFVDVVSYPNPLSQDTITPIRLFENDGSSLKFVQEIGNHRSISFAVSDYDNDGDMDIYVQQKISSDENGFAVDTIYVNQAEDKNAVLPFTKTESPYKPKTATHLYARNPVWVDYNNDGNKDIFFAYGKPGLNRLFRNTGDHKTYEEDAALTGIQGTFDLYDSHNAYTTWVDYDHDGDVEAYITNSMWFHKFYNNSYYENGGTAHWLHLRLVGTTINKDAIGARVQIVFNDGSILSDQVLQTHQSGGQNPRVLYFGLGDKSLDDIGSLTVYWPNGQAQVVELDAVDTRVTIIQEVSPVLGDADKNGLLDIGDALCLKFVSEQGTHECFKNQLDMVDLDCNGKITDRDVEWIQKQLASHPYPNDYNENGTPDCIEFGSNPSTVVYGDVDLDQKVTVADLQCYVLMNNQENVPACFQITKEEADVNCDGAVDATEVDWVKAFLLSKTYPNDYNENGTPDCKEFAQ